VLGERVLLQQWAGLVLGLVGVGMVVSDKMAAGSATWTGFCSALLALLGITLGTLYQKRFCSGMDLRSGGVIQYAATALVLLGLALLFESMRIRWTAEFVFALSWLVLVLSVGAVGLLYTLIRRGAAARVASLFYLTPPFTAIFAYALFGERLSPLAVLGIGITVIGVLLVNTPAGAGRT
jgi:drug/metabolite transporter (DMT)-like permease